MSLMGHFKKNKDDYKKAYQSLNEDTGLKTSRDRIYFEQLENGDVGSVLAKKLLDGIPLVLNFDLLDVDTGNMILAFLSGVLFTMDGEVIEIKEKNYLFARKQDFIDGTLREFLDEIWGNK